MLPDVEYDDKLFVDTHTSLSCDNQIIIVNGTVKMKTHWDYYLRGWPNLVDVNFKQCINY